MIGAPRAKTLVPLSGSQWAETDTSPVDALLAAGPNRGTVAVGADGSAFEDRAAGVLARE